MAAFGSGSAPPLRSLLSHAPSLFPRPTLPSPDPLPIVAADPRCRLPSPPLLLSAIAVSEDARCPSTCRCPYRRSLSLSLLSPFPLPHPGRSPFSNVRLTQFSPIWPLLAHLLQSSRIWPLVATLAFTQSSHTRPLLSASGHTCFWQHSPLGSPPHGHFWATFASAVSCSAWIGG